MIDALHANRFSWVAVAAGAALAGPTLSAGDNGGAQRDPAPHPQQTESSVMWTDARNDAAPRRTDNGSAAGPFDMTLPDVLSLTLRAWSPINAAADPFDGTETAAANAGLFRVDIAFAGLLSPPGTLGVGGRPFDPFRFGPAPVYGFVEFDIDDNLDTGGELGEAAESTYLANVGRFGGLPRGARADRAVRWGDQIDDNFNSDPQYERSGAEFVLSLCGCADVTLVSGDANDNGEFDSGEVWIISGRFFRRAGGYSPLSNAFNGSEPGEYDPIVQLRFEHDPTGPGDGRTIVSLVFALNASGAAALAGSNVQPANLDVSDQPSIEEAMLDIVNALSFNPAPGPATVLAAGWENADIEASLNPATWDVSAIFAAPYNAPGALYIYSDVGFDNRFGDLTGDGVVNQADLDEWDAAMAANDGGPRDADDAPGSISLLNRPRNFSVYDINNDGVIDELDRAILESLAPVPGDLNGDGVVSAADLATLLGDWGTDSPRSDLNGDGVVNSLDLAIMLGNWGSSGSS